MTGTCLRIAVASVLISFLAPVVTLAQSCALCYTQAAGSGSRMIAALRSGILILAIPPVVICVAIAWMAYKKRNQFNDDERTDLPEGD
jgi:ABC-type Fe3+ transport system permease subunit